MDIYDANRLIELTAASSSRYREFLRTIDLSAGLYSLPAGSRDEQQPHTEDEIYIVLSGVGQVHVAGEDAPVGSGAVIFVPAHAVHYFHDIAETLHLLVLFAPAEGTRRQPVREDRHGRYEMSTDRSRLDVDLIHSYLSEEAYWSRGISRERVERSIAGALCFGIYHESNQVAFGRVITDYATFAYISDLFVLPEHRERGLAHWLVSAMLAHPDCQGLRKWVLHTRDAHPLYRQHGFSTFDQVPSYMEFRP